ncbi:hypothetical protein QMA69_05370 [Burkholderia pseudomallei]|uniref:hypothetical protein n=1 Tax=Burkholderia pseudomallei TaxID=28450 RepID=UPI002DB7B21F|nr:hypothetical protein [Burkholderia pseudomallei]MEB5483941.1 hypothetical protein [Burkholderia pseudomallei]MEB5490804.1 hypothetical protein [Burkholderia pseudomallei]MEB5497492.1 hypothetical protein [Burkholderia pseudomallei]MEB5502778.1 hypothetical protein [Burkholderia pseudomallei]MEB5510158.1 hypothetical protein [Burkholderia pseudomallei]
MEQLRIIEYTKGWNDAAAARTPRSTTIAYRLGYADARRTYIRNFAATPMRKNASFAVIQD